MQEIEKKFVAARMGLTKDVPYLAPVMLRMPFVFTDKIPAAAACDAKGRVYVHTELAAPWPIRMAAGVLLHETFHFVYDHFGRLGSRDPKIWNIAADILINEQVLLMGYQLPEGCVSRAIWSVPDSLTSTEEVYDFLMASGQPDDGEGNPCGTGSVGTELGDAAGAGELVGEDADMARNDVAAQVGRLQGTVPAGLSVWADERVGTAKVNWRAKLASLLARANSTFVRGRVQSDWRRVSRRSDAVGERMPGRVQPVPRIACIIDTSGSMWGDGAAVLSEAMGVVDASGYKVDMLSCDSAAGRVVQVGKVGDLRGALTGGGGTDLQPAVDALEPVRQYSALIVFTDGFLDRVVVPAGPRVIWCITASGEVRDWMRGDVVQLKP